MNPLFTIVTCTRNSMLTLQETVRSVQMQTFTDYEHLFIDGNSTDGTLEYLRSLPGNVRIVEGGTGGISRAMNAGIQYAHGRYVAHLHSDDYYASPDALEIVARAFRESGARWLFGRCRQDVDGTVSGGPHAFRYSFDSLLRRNYIPHPSTFAERRLFEECGDFDPTIRYAMDYDLWLRFASKAEPLQVDADLAVFRVHDGSLSSANRLEAFEDDHRVRMKFIGASPLRRIEHQLRYFVRRRRLLKALAGEGR